jgi:hypothetical protein
MVSVRVKRRRERIAEGTDENKCENGELQVFGEIRDLKRTPIFFGARIPGVLSAGE